MNLSEISFRSVIFKTEVPIWEMLFVLELNRLESMIYSFQYEILPKNTGFHFPLWKAEETHNTNGIPIFLFFCSYIKSLTCFQTSSNKRGRKEFYLTELWRTLERKLSCCICWWRLTSSHQKVHSLSKFSGSRKTQACKGTLSIRCEEVQVISASWSFQTAFYTVQWRTVGK